MVFREFKLGIGQMLVEGGKVESNIKRAEKMIKSSAECDCRIIVLPECLDSGWTDPSAFNVASEIPGETSGRLSDAARDNRIMVVAGLTEADGDNIYNAAILFDEKGKILLKHRKINVLTIAQHLYKIGNLLSVVDTRFGTLGVNICADNFKNSLAIGHVQARMGAQILLSPSSWAVKTDHDNIKQPYGEWWKKCYSELCKLYRITIVGVSNVGWIRGGPWKGRKVIGCSLAIGSEGKVLAQGSYGPDAESLITFKVQAKPRKVKGTEYGKYLKDRGYEGP